MSYASDRIGSWEQYSQAQHLTEPLRNFNRSTPGMTPSLAWYLTSLAPLTREHAELTRFRASSGEQALFIAPERGQPVVRFVDKASGQWLPARAAQIEQTAAGRWLVADLAQRAKALEAGDDASLVAVALRIAPAGPDLTKLTWSAQAGFLEALETPDESV